MAESESNRFFRKLFGFSIGPIVNAALGFVSVPITTWLIVPEELGRASMFTTAHSLIGMFVYLGLDAAYQRHYHDFKDHKQLLFQALWPPTLIVLSISTVILVFYPFISRTLFGVVDIVPIALLSMYLFIHIGMHYSQYIMLMQERAKAYSVGQILEKISRVVALVGFMLLFERSFRSVILASITAQLITTTYFVVMTRKDWRLHLKNNWNLQKEMFRFGLPLVPAAALSWVFNSIDKIAIRTWSDFDQIGIYAGAFKLVAALNIMKKSFGSFWPPVALRWYSNNAPDRRFQRVSDTLMSVMAAMFIVIVLLRDVVYYILPPAYAASASLVPFLLFLPLMMTVSESTMVGITFSKKTHHHITVTLVASLVNVFGNWMLVPRYGAIGAAVSTAFSFNVFFWMRTLLSKKEWPVLKLRFHALNSILLAGLVFSTLLTGKTGKLIEIAFSMFILVLNYRNLKTVLQKLFRQFFSRKRKK